MAFAAARALLGAGLLALAAGAPRAARAGAALRPPRPAGRSPSALEGWYESVTTVGRTSTSGSAPAPPARLEPRRERGGRRAGARRRRPAGELARSRSTPRSRRARRRATAATSAPRSSRPSSTSGSGARLASRLAVGPLVGLGLAYDPIARLGAAGLGAASPPASARPASPPPGSRSACSCASSAARIARAPGLQIPFRRRMQASQMGLSSLFLRVSVSGGSV